MKPLKVLPINFIAILLISAVAFAASYDWMRDFNIRAEADPAEFRARLETRFKIVMNFFLAGSYL